MFVRGFVMSTILIALALYVDIFEASGMVAGLFGTASALAQFIFVLPIGRRVDIGNPKQYLLGGLLLNGVMLLGFMVVTNATHVVILRALQGIGSLLLLIPATTAIGELSPNAERGLWIGTANQIRALSGLLGNVIGGLLLYQFGFKTTYSFSILVVMVSITLIYLHCSDDLGARKDPDEATLRETLQLLWKQRSLKALVIFRFGFAFGKSAVILFVPIFARTEFGMSAIAIGAIAAAGMVSMSLAQGYVGTISDRTGNQVEFIVFGTFLFALSAVLIPLATMLESRFDPILLQNLGQSVTFSAPFLWMFAMFAVLGFADSLRLPTSLTLYIEEGEHQNAVGSTLSIRSLSWQSGSIVGPLAFGGILDYLSSFYLAFFAAAALLAVSTLLFYSVYSPEPRVIPDL